MLLWSKKIKNLLRTWLKTSVVLLLMVSLSLGLSSAWWDLSGGDSGRTSRLAQGDAITDAKALLRYALPIDNDTIRDIQQNLEDISYQLRGKRWGPISSDLRRISMTLDTRASDILASIPEDRQAQAKPLVEQLRQGLGDLETAVEAKDRPGTQEVRDRLLATVGQLEQMMVTGFPFEVPEEYANLPQLKGRATVAIETDKGPITVVVDGYSAPVTAGNFIDLVQRGFYDGLEFIRSEGNYVLQTGDPPGPDEGFIDPKTGEYRNIPLEILVRGDDQPTYGITLEQAGRYQENPVLPFSAYGAVAMARPEIDPDGGSSQFFFFLFDRELTPPGFNLLDGRYSVFGYVVEGEDILEELKQGNKIISAKAIEGSENLVEP
jgi:peptidylprolyl isomerase